MHIAHIASIDSPVVAVLKVARCQNAFEISKGYIYIKVLLKLPVVKVLLKYQRDTYTSKCF